MEEQNQGQTTQEPTAGQKIIDGLGQIFGGLVQQPRDEKGINPTGGKNSFKLRYAGGEEREVYDDEIGGDMPTVAEAFTEYASDLGLDPNRTATYRVGATDDDQGGVVDGSKTVEYGRTYVASVARARKG